MEIQINGKLYDATAHALEYSNDMLNGVLIDLGEQYLFLSDHIDSHRESSEEIEEYIYYDMRNQDVDLESEPHSWVVKSVGRLIVRTAEDLLK